jgi:hypothetical protein
MNIEINDKIAYSLGFFWADGYINKKTKLIGLFIKSEDFNQIENSLFELIPFKNKIVRYENNPKHKPQSGFHITNSPVYDFLFENEYHNKSKVSPFKVLQLIPKNLHKYFIRGFLDGDGTITHKRSYSVSFTGHYEQNWDWLIDFFNDFNIKTNYYKYESENGSLSRITIYNIDNCIKFFDEIYPNNYFDFGLKRKYESLLEIKSKKDSNLIKSNKLKRQTIIEYSFKNNKSGEIFTILGEKNVYSFFKEKNKFLKKNEKYSGQKIIDKEKTTQNDIMFLGKKRIKKYN